MFFFYVQRVCIVDDVCIDFGYDDCHDDDDDDDGDDDSSDNWGGSQASTQAISHLGDQTDTCPSWHG